MKRSEHGYQTRPDTPDMGRGRAPHPDRTVFTTWLLWLIGYSEADIAARLQLARKQVSGIIARSPYSNRSAMSDAVRQQKYQELASNRFDDDGNPLDGGMLKHLPKKVNPLKPNQRKER